MFGYRGKKLSYRGNKTFGYRREMNVRLSRDRLSKMGFWHFDNQTFGYRGTSVYETGKSFFHTPEPRTLEPRIPDKMFRIRGILISCNLFVND